MDCKTKQTQLTSKTNRVFIGYNLYLLLWLAINILAASNRITGAKKKKKIELNLASNLTSLTDGYVRAAARASSFGTFRVYNRAGKDGKPFIDSFKLMNQSMTRFEKPQYVV